jgi:hypothetical protein
VPSILQNGLLVRAGEPSLTTNPASALLKYANPGSNSKHVHSGKAAAQIEELLAAGTIAAEPKETLVKRAAAYWSEDPSCGAAFVIDTAGLHPGPAAAGDLQLKNGCAVGGVTKWVYAHLAPMPHDRADTTAITTTTTIAADRIRGYLRPSRGWKTLFEGLHPLLREAVPSIEAASAQIALHLKNGTDYVALQAERPAYEIARGAIVGFLFQELRKYFLTVLHAKGYSIVKNDIAPAESWSDFLPEAAVARLQAARYADRVLENTKKELMDAIKNMKGTGGEGV